MHPLECQCLLSHLRISAHHYISGWQDLCRNGLAALCVHIWLIDVAANICISRILISVNGLRTLIGLGSSVSVLVFAHLASSLSILARIDLRKSLVFAGLQ